MTKSRYEKESEKMQNDGVIANVYQGTVGVSRVFRKTFSLLEECVDWLAMRISQMMAKSNADALRQIEETTK